MDEQEKELNEYMGLENENNQDATNNMMGSPGKKQRAKIGGI